MTGRPQMARAGIALSVMVMVLGILGGTAAAGGGDADGDGVVDAVDNCPFDANPDQFDTDGDNAGDVCDPDLDGDGVGNFMDNCPSDANADQFDTDGDNAGDVCDLDVDGDGVGNVVDNCPSDANADQADIDGDGLGDVCDETDDRPRPDARIRKGTGALTTNDVYNTDAAGQGRWANVRSGGTVTFTVQIRNDGPHADTVRVQGLGSTSRYAVTYRNGPTNVTPQVVAGTFQYGPVAPGGTRNLTVTIKAKAGAPVGAVITRRVTVTSQSNTAIKDAVKATVTRI